MISMSYSKVPLVELCLLVAAVKSGTSERRFYRELIRKADERFDAHLARLRSVRLKKEGR